VFFITVWYILYSLSKKLNSSFWAIDIFLALLLLSSIIYSSFKPFSISALNFSYLNMIYSISNFISNKFKFTNSIEFKPYRVEKIESKEKIENIVVVVGESLSSKRMGLFGYSIDNTPHLNTLKLSSNFYYEEILSGGVNTPVSIVTFFTLKREPQNIDILRKPTTNLLYLAKARGYNTYWFSMQDEGMSISSIVEYADYIKVRGDHLEGSFDEVLIDDLKDINWSRKNFIVLHLRANHSPYEKYIPKEFRVSKYNRLDYHQYKIASYSDSVRYVDYVLDKLFKYLQTRGGDFKLYFISDHGERLGYRDDNFKYGHSELDFEVAKTPLLIYSNRDLNISGRFRNHYRVGESILKDLGFRLINPNDNRTYYINGLNIAGGGGFLEYRLDK